MPIDQVAGDPMQYTDAVIKDTSGASIPTKLDSLVLDPTSPASPLVSGTVPAFAVRRYLLVMPPGKEADLSLALPDGGIEMHTRPPSSFPWSGMPPSWPIACDGEARLRILLTSTTTASPPRFALSLPRFADSTCPSPSPGAVDPCLIGIWFADDAVYRDYLAGLLPGGSQVDSVTGTSVLTFDAGGRVAVAFDDFAASYSHPLTTSSGTMDVEGRIVVNGRGAGTWTSDGNAITYSPGNYAFTVRITLSFNGVEIGSSDREVPQDFAGAPFSSVRGYVCTPTTLTETVEIAGAPRIVVWDRH